MKTLALILFLLTYLLLIFMPKYRTQVAVVVAFLFVLLGILPYNKVFSTIDWNVILMITGTMGIVSLL
ncbi:hypothetical protein [Caloramator sp. mosi_1]|uniref:hypothetical protein n=1 Tax=Caloramator sp. mosi_1 TaxID=3023090 RepID=UPI0030819FAB